jgi:hypothetical protein
MVSLTYFVKKLFPLKGYFWVGSRMGKAFCIVFLLSTLTFETLARNSNETLTTLEGRDSDSCPIPDGHYLLDVPRLSGAIMLKSRNGNCFLEIGFAALGCGCNFLSFDAAPTVNGVQEFLIPNVASLFIVGTSAAGRYPVLIHLKDEDLFFGCDSPGYYAGILRVTENRDGLNAFQSMSIAQQKSACFMP